MNEAAYRAAERRLWESVGLSPREHRVPLAATGTTVRVQEVGEGTPVLFVHGAPNAGSTWAPLLPHVPGLRALLLDRPGTGLSDDWQMTGDVPAVAGRMVADVLDALGLAQAHVVASSLGGFLALHSAAATPARIGRMVQMACPAMAPGMRVPAFMRPLRFAPVRWLVPRLPPSRAYNDDVLRQLGHGASLAAGRIPAAFDDWYLALQRHTHTVRNDVAAIGRVLRGDGVDPSLTLDRRLLGRVQAPTRFLWGAEDGFGGADVARATVRAMPHASLDMLPGFGHLPWLDDPAGVGARTAAFLRGD